MGKRYSEAATQISVVDSNCSCYGIGRIVENSMPSCCRAAAVSNGIPSLHSTLRRLNKELTQVEHDQQSQKMPAPTEGPVETSGADADTEDTAESKNSFSASAADASCIEDRDSDEDSEEDESHEAR